jgi:hypothetical protein
MTLTDPGQRTPLYVRCEDCWDFFHATDKLARREWIFRGHKESDLKRTDKDWRLESTLYRHFHDHDKITRLFRHAREGEMLRRFKQVAHSYLSHVPAHDDDLSWLAHMQHYGSPTRLLDFTFSAAVALYFAIREVVPGKKPWCVHALHVPSLAEHSHGLRQDANPRGNIRLRPRLSEYRIGKKPGTVDFVGVADGSLMNVRQAAQEGVFLIPSRVDLDLEAWLRRIKPPSSLQPHGTHWLKFVFENTAERYYKTVRQLTKAGMAPLRVFPGLEGVCESMRFALLDSPRDYTPAEELEIIRGTSH